MIGSSKGIYIYANGRAQHILDKVNISVLSNYPVPQYGKVKPIIECIFISQCLSYITVQLSLKLQCLSLPEDVFSD
jgi:hypothetical protein